MTVLSAATSYCKKAMKIGRSLFHRGFSSSKCKTIAKVAVARIKSLRNKREVVVRQMRRDIAMLLETKQHAIARIRVEHVIREQNVLAANELIELFCELIVAKLPIIAKKRECPADLKEGISSLIFSAPRCSEIPELLEIRDVFEEKYGKDFVSAATDLRPNASVNRMLIEKLSVKAANGEVKLKVMKEIAMEYKVEWDATESEMELHNPLASRASHDGESCYNKIYDDPASAAKASAEFAKQAIAAAEAAAYLANKDLPPMIHRRHSYSATSTNTKVKYDESDSDDESSGFVSRRICKSHSYKDPSPHSGVKFDESDGDKDTETEETRWGGMNNVTEQPALQVSHVQLD